MFPDFATDEAQSFHDKLARFNVIRMALATPSSDWQATTRRYAYQAIGALGVIELTAPERARKVAFGMQRLGLDGRTRAYFELHTVLDVAHARSWIAEVSHAAADKALPEMRCKAARAARRGCVIQYRRLAIDVAGQ